MYISSKGFIHLFFFPPGKVAKVVKRITISLSEKLPTALVSQRVARLMQTFDKKYARRVFSRWKVRLAPPVISGPCFAKEVEVSELLRVYLAEHDRTLFPIRFPANWNFDNQNNKTCSKVPGKKKQRWAKICQSVPRRVPPNYKSRPQKFQRGCFRH